MTIAKRMFLALTLVSVMILGLNAALSRFNIERGFLDYVAEQEADRITELATDLAALYAREGGWQTLQNNPRRWNDLLRQSGDAPPPRARGPERGPGFGPDGRRGPGPEGKRPPPDPLALGRRISLVDTGGRLIAGRAENMSAADSVPVSIDGETIGSVVVSPMRSVTNAIDQRFLDEQERAIYSVAAIALILAAIISAILARQMTQSIRSLATGTRAIAAGDLKTRIPDGRRDELGDLARDFNRLARTLETSRESRRQWMADIAHELRTPLAILRGELEALEDGVRKFDDTTRTSLQAEIARLTNLVSDLRELADSDEGALQYERRRTNLVPVLDSALNTARPRLADAGIRMQLDLPDGEMIVFADRTRIEQLVANLLQNVIRYTDSPGDLAVSAEVDAGFVRIEFADSGPGVPDEALPKLFDRLFRVETSRSRATGGAGLGLSICRSIAEAHGGTIHAAHSDLGGLSVVVRLPLDRRREART